MDYLRIPIRTSMRLDPNSPAWTEIRWFKADARAKVFPDYHLFASTIWDEEDQRFPEHEPNTGLGEQGHAPRVYSGIGNRDGLTGQNFCGPLRAWQEGPSILDPVLPLGPDGVPTCCRRPVQVSDGGTAEGGSGWPFVSFILAHGGTAEGGADQFGAGVMLWVGGPAEGFYSWVIEPPMSITITTETGVPNFSGIATLELDSQAGTVSQPATGRARYILRPADLTHEGLVSLGPQSMGAGAKFFSDKIGIGTVLPLANVALDVRGYGGAYVGGTIYFGAGNFPVGEEDAARLQWNPGTPFELSCLVGLAATGPGKMLGWRINPVSCKMQLIYRSPGTPLLTFLNTDTGLEASGATLSLE